MRAVFSKSHPDLVTVLSDTAVRGKDLDDEKANAAKAAAEEAVKNAKGEIDLARAQSQLAVMAAQIAALRKYRQKKWPTRDPAIESPALAGFFVGWSPSA